MSMKANLLSLFFLISLSATAFAGTGAVTGDVADQYALPLPSVEVTVTNTATSDQYSAYTNDRGVFIINNVNSGEYSATAKMAGFKTAVAPRITVKDGKTSKIKLTMAIGAD